MRQYWRMQQSQSIISLGLLGSTLTLLLWDYVSWRFSDKCDEGFCFSNSVLGIPATYIGLLSIFAGLILIVLCVGYLYDRVFYYGLLKEVLILKEIRFGHMLYLQCS